jgi:hypothetical protein
MSRRHIGTAAIALVALLACPKAGHANIIDWIWTMSGPQMVGLVLHCEYDIQNNISECRGLDYRFVGKLEPRDTRRVWLSIDTGFYTGTGRNSDGYVFRRFKDRMIAFEPIVEMRSYTSKDRKVTYHHGLVGVSWDYLYGEGYEGFDKFGVKFRPVGVTINRKWNMSYTLRIYPNGFTPDEFGFVPREEDADRPVEILHGFTFGIIWGRR